MNTTIGQTNSAIGRLLPSGSSTFKSGSMLSQRLIAAPPARWA